MKCKCQAKGSLPNPRMLHTAVFYECKSAADKERLSFVRDGEWACCHCGSGGIEAVACGQPRDMSGSSCVTG